MSQATLLFLGSTSLGYANPTSCFFVLRSRRPAAKEPCLYDLSQRDRVRGLTTVVVGALGALTFMVSTVLPDTWSTTAMFGGAAVATSALTVLVTLTARFVRAGRARLPMGYVMQRARRGHRIGGRAHRGGAPSPAPS